jgi:hypothetical protein
VRLEERDRRLTGRFCQSFQWRDLRGAKESQLDENQARIIMWGCVWSESRTSVLRAQVWILIRFNAKQLIKEFIICRLDLDVVEVPV